MNREKLNHALAELEKLTARIRSSESSNLLATAPGEWAATMEYHTRTIREETGIHSPAPTSRQAVLL